MKITFNIKYFIGFILLFLVEVVIAKFVDDDFVRPFVGDYLVMILIYLFTRSFLKGSVVLHIICVLLFCFAVEIGQKFNLVGMLGLERYKLARIIVGSHYDIRDLVAYSLAALTLLIMNRKLIFKHKGLNEIQ